MARAGILLNQKVEGVQQGARMSDGIFLTRETVKILQFNMSLNSSCLFIATVMSMLIPVSSFKVVPI